MPDEVQDDVVVDDSQDTVEDDSPMEEEPQKPFTEEQVQYMQSWMGRKIKEGLDTHGASINSRFDEVMQSLQNRPEQDTGERIKQYNSELSMELLDNPLGAIEKGMKVLSESKQRELSVKKANIKKALTTYSDDPFYKDICAEAEKIAEMKAEAGWPGAAAAEAGYTAAKLNFLQAASGNGTQGLSMAKPGKRTVTPKSAKLPPKFESQFQKDKAKGLFKTREEYVQFLSPHVKEQYGIE